MSTFWNRMHILRVQQVYGDLFSFSHMYSLQGNIPTSHTSKLEQRQVSPFAGSDILPPINSPWN